MTQEEPLSVGELKIYVRGKQDKEAEVLKMIEECKIHTAGVLILIEKKEITQKIKNHSLTEPGTVNGTVKKGTDELCECGHDYDTHLESSTALINKGLKGCTIEVCPCKKFKKAK